MVDNTGQRPTEYEYALAFKRSLAAGYAKNQAGAGRMFGFSQATVSKSLAMLELPHAVLALLDAQPALFGVRTAAAVSELWAQYPDHTHVILDGIRRFTDGMEQAELPKWVKDQVAKATRKQTPPVSPTVKTKPRRQSINSATGGECYVTILKEKAMVIDLHVRVPYRVLTGAQQRGSLVVATAWKVGRFLQHAVKHCARLKEALTGMGVTILDG